MMRGRTTVLRHLSLAAAIAALPPVFAGPLTPAPRSGDKRPHPHGQLRFGDPVVAGAREAAEARSFHFRADQVVEVTESLSGLTPDVPAHAVAVWGGLLATPAWKSRDVLRNNRRFLQPTSATTDSESTAIFTWVDTIAESDARDLDTGDRLLCAIAYARWRNAAGRFETRLSECLDPTRCRMGVFEWVPNPENNSEVPDTTKG